MSWILAAVCLAVFGITAILDVLRVLSRPETFSLFGLSYYGVVDRLRVFQFLTHPFFHGGVAHLVFNMLTLCTLGRRVEQTLGVWRYLALTAASAFCGALAFLFVDWDGTSVALGYSAIIFGLLAAGALLHPEDQIILIAFPMRMKHAALLLSAIELYLAVCSESGGLANVAHLFGAFGALAYLRGRQWLRWPSRVKGRSPDKTPVPRRRLPYIPHKL